MLTNMSTLRVIQYTPKLSNNSIPQLPTKPWWNDTREEPVRTLSVSTKVAEKNDWQQNRARDSEDTVQEGPTVDTESTQGMCVDILLVATVWSDIL